MRAIPTALLLLLLPTSALAQASNWWGGAASGTGYPTNSTPVTASATGTTAAVTATLPAVTGKTTFICGFAMTSGGTTTAVFANATVTGTIGGTLNFAYGDPAPAAGQGRLVVGFSPVCIPASAQNTAISVTQPGGGTGTTAAAVSVWGYQL